MSRKRFVLVIAAVLVFGASLIGGTWLISNAVNDTTIEAEQNAEQTEKLEKEAEIRRKQFCRVLLSQHHDKVVRRRNTVVYLHSEAGREPTAINMYIREVSLPQTEIELTKETERIPPVCKRDRKDRSK